MSKRERIWLTVLTMITAVAAIPIIVLNAYFLWTGIASGFRSKLFDFADRPSGMDILEACSCEPSDSVALGSLGVEVSSDIEIKEV